MILRFIPTLILLFLMSPVLSQNISLDTTFGANGYQFEYGVFSGNYKTASVLLANQQIIVAGTKNASTEFYVSKYNTDGSFDTSFGTNGFGSTTTSSIANQKESVYTIALQQDGKIVIAGKSDINSSLSGFYYNAFLARLNADGTLDATFGNNGYVKTELGSNEDFINDIFITNTNTIYAVSHSIDGTGKNTAQVLKYNTNGSLDSSFGSNGILNITSTDELSLTTIFVQSDNSILLSGSKTDTANNKDFLLTKLNSDGSFDTSFGSNGKVITDFGYLNETINNFVVTDSKIIATGTISSTSFLPHIGIASYNFDGTLDTSFSTDGKIIETPDNSNYSTCFGTDLNIMPNGKLLVSGNAIGNNNYDLILVSYNTDGTKDTNFGSSGQYLHQNSTLQEFSNNVLILNNEKILTIGVKTSSANTSPQTMLVRFKDAFTLSTDNFELNSSIEIYPNPTHDLLKINSKTNINKITLYSITGKLIKTYKASNMISIGSLKTGTYIIEVSNNEKSYVSKIVKL